MKAVKGVFFLGIIVFTYYGLLRYYGDILSYRGGEDWRRALTDIGVYVIAALHLWLLQRALIKFSQTPQDVT